MFKTTPRLMNEAGGDGGTGGGAPDGGGAPAAPAAPATVMQSGASAAPAAPTGSEWNAPDKYIVKNGDAVDWQATARKIDEGRSHLEKRMGAGDVPPADVSGYKLAVPEAHAEALKGWDVTADPKLQAFLADAHKVGMTQAQVDVVMGAYAGMAAEALGTQLSPEAKMQAEADATAKALGEVWKDQGEFDKNVGLAFQAGNKLANKLGVPFDEFNAALGNNAMFLRLAAMLAPEMGEDTPAGTQDGAGSAGGIDEQLATLKAQKAELPEKDPRRQALQDKINALYAKKYPG